MGDKKSHKQSKADIAKQFDLPERQSKITTLLNQAGQAYCICRTSDSSRFMIGCDACEEWYHGDCINISEKEARYIRQYYCDRCRAQDPSLTTRFKAHKREEESDYAGHTDRKKKRKERSEKVRRPSSPSTTHAPASQGPGRPAKCGTCSGCTRTLDCGRCEPCIDMVKYGSNTKLKLRCKHRICIGPSVTPRTKTTTVKKSSSGRSKRRSGETGSGAEAPSAVLSHLQGIRQCYGPQCTKHALPTSKYCSPACGIRLATARIYQVLPQRIQEWSMQSCVAEASDRRSLNTVRARLADVRAALQKLEQRRQAIDDLVERAKNAVPSTNAPEEPEEEGEVSMYCITCGHEIHSRTAVKHMEKCFNKYEAQSSFGSVFKTRIEGNNMFCDFYNPANRTYCKRLRVLCPEHSKEPKVTDTDVCGCPLVKDIFIQTGEFCRAPRKSCLKHHAWEKLRRAEVDMERVRQWLKVDELMEQERNIRYAMASRAGVLGLMLHSTYNHPMMEMITKKMQASAANK